MAPAVVPSTQGTSAARGRATHGRRIWFCEFEDQEQEKQEEHLANDSRSALATPRSTV